MLVSVFKELNLSEENVLKFLNALLMLFIIALAVFVKQDIKCKMDVVYQLISLFLLVLQTHSLMVFLALVTVDSSSKVSTLVLIAQQEPSGMVKNVVLNPLKHVQQDIFSTLIMDNVNQKALHAVTMHFSMVLHVFV